MAVSPYFNHVSHPGEQKLAEDLLVEAIQQRGVDSFYIPRELIEEEAMFNEANINKFSNAKSVEMYVEAMSNFNGQGDIFQKFGGFSLDDTATFVYSAKRFKEELLGLREEPKAGDLIYLNFADQIFEVQKRLEDEDYRQLGVNRNYRLQVTKFKYGHESFETGEVDIDDVEDLFEEFDLNEPELINTVDPRDVREEIDLTPEVNDDIIEFGR